MKEKRTVYDRKFKEEAVRLSYERKNVIDLSRELGINPELLYRWRRELSEKGALSFPGQGKEALSTEAKELAFLRKKLQEKESELEILKKAMGIISRSDR